MIDKELGSNEICESVVHHVSKQEAADNTTMILLQFNWHKDPKAAIKHDTDLHQTQVTSASKRNNVDESLTMEGKVATKVAEPVMPDAKKVKLTVDDGLDKLQQQ